MTETTSSLSHLPPSWVYTTLGDICETVEKVNTKLEPNKKFNYIEIASVDNSKQKITNVTPYLGKNAPSRARQLVKSGDVLFSTVRTYLKNIAMVDPSLDGEIASTGFCVIRPTNFVANRLIFYLVQTDSFLNQLTQMQRGTSYPAVRDSDVFSRPVALPPFNEQHRIVGKVEELFSFLDTGVESLRKVQAQLKRYRQAVLKYAFEGKLTEEWRKTHRDQIEPAKKLLEQVEQERLKKSKRRKKPFSLDTSNLPKLPDGWVWTSFEGLAEDSPNAIKAGPFGSNLKKEFYVAKGFKVYGQEQVIRDDPSYGNYYIDKERYEKLKPCAVKPGDILISLVGTIGKVLILPDEIEQGIINPRLVKLSLDKRLTNPKYVKAYFISSTVKEYFSLSSHGGTMDILNLSILKTLPIGLPPLKEQEVIIEELERTFSLSDDVENVVKESVRRAEKLRESILKNAFEGKLVPQDPGDEPAEKLLKRIRGESAKSKDEKDTNTKNKSQLELSTYVK